MKSYGRTSISEFLGDRVVYRNLEPADGRLPPLGVVGPQVGLPPGRIPRKTEPDYARVMVAILRAARALDRPGTTLQRLIFIGDTRLLDGTAFTNLCQAGGWSGLAFIGSENSKPATVEIVPADGGTSLYLANRWSALDEFSSYCPSHGFPVDPSTAIILDIDKTTLGARGRNGQVIDGARVQAVYNTVSALLGAAFDPAAFRSAYDLLNQPEFHPFTADNQDYLAYVCLILGSGLYTLPAVVDEVRAKRLTSFEQFITQVDGRLAGLPAELAAIHRQIYVLAQAGDPTPFKAFRRNEYITTIGCFGKLDDAASMEELLATEIVITQEVRQLALDWGRNGALLFGLSDKPDEASIPTAELAAQGYQPLHRAVTHAVGE
jgi:hypothetical protein